jgi:ankyrin repeat protein
VEDQSCKCDETIRDNYDGMTCTMQAASQGHVAILKYLVEDQSCKCDETIRDNNNMTCTMLAAYEGHEAIVKYLVEEQGAKCDGILSVESDDEDYDDDFTHTISAKELKCPISLKLMTDPVICSDGHSYQRSAIMKWMGRKDVVTSPMNPSVNLDPKIMIENFHLKSQVLEFIEGSKQAHLHAR